MRVLIVYVYSDTPECRCFFADFDKSVHEVISPNQIEFIEADSNTIDKFLLKIIYHISPRSRESAYIQLFDNLDFLIPWSKARKVETM